jgi:hypothetical protein
MQLEAKRSKMSAQDLSLSSEKLNNYFSNQYKGTRFINKHSFVHSEDPSWWKDVENKTNELIYYITASDSMHYFSEALRELNYIVSNPVDLDYEIISIMQVNDSDYFLDYLETMAEAARNQDPETYVNALDGLIDYVGSITTVNPMVASKKAEELYIDWEEIETATRELLALSRRRDPKSFMQELDYLNTLILGQVSMPDDLSDSEIVDSDFR